MGTTDFNNNIKPERSRWFNVSFTWIGGKVSVTSKAIQLTSKHKEIEYMPGAPTANLVPQ